MKFIIDKKIILEMLQKVSRAISGSSTIGVLSYVLIEAKKSNVVSLSGTDLKLGIKVESKADVEKPGSVCLDAKVLLSIIKEFQVISAITIEIVNEKVSISSEKSVFSIPYLVAKNFPEFPEITNLDLTTEIFRRDIISMFCSFSRTSISVPEKDKQIYNAPSGVLVKSTDNGIEFVGTDGHRMSYVLKSSMDSFDNIKFNHIIPKNFVENLSKVFSGKDFEQNSIRLFITEDVVYVFSDSIVCFCKTLARKFPDYSLITSQYPHTFTVKKEDILSSIKRVSVVANTRDPYIIFSIFPTLLSLTIDCVDLGSASDELPIDYNGNAFEIGLNPKYLIDILNVISEKNVTFEFLDAESPVFIKENDNIKYVVMPVRL